MVLVNTSVTVAGKVFRASAKIKLPGPAAVAVAQLVKHPGLWSLQEVQLNWWEFDSRSLPGHLWECEAKHIYADISARIGPVENKVTWPQLKMIFFLSGKEKLNYPMDKPVYVVLEEDGTEVDEEEYFQTLPGEAPRLTIIKGAPNLVRTKRVQKPHDT